MLDCKPTASVLGNAADEEEKKTMIVIELYTREYDSDSRSSFRKLAARIEVDGQALRVVEGDPEWVHIKDIVLNHPGTKDDLTFEQDPALWAATVPEAFRTGDTLVEVSQPTPVEDENVLAEDELIAEAELMAPEHAESR
jgi:hypothetical protein